MFTPPSMDLAGGGAQPAAAVPAAPKKSFSISDLQQYVHIVVKRIWLVALSFVISLAMAVIMLARQEPRYSCRATLLLSHGLPVPMSMRQMEVQPLGDYVATQQLIIQSGLLMARARERIQRAGLEVGGKILDVQVYPVGRTAFMAIQVDSLDPVVGAEMANALADEYLDFKAEERMDTSQATVVSLTQQANRLHEELKKAEERALQFVRENSVVAIQERGNIAAQHLGQLSAQAASYRTERMFLEAQQPLLAQASDEAVLSSLLAPVAPSPYWGIASLGAAGGGSNEVMPVVLQGRREGLVEYGVVAQSDWGALKRRKAMLEAQLTEYRKKYRDAHPLVRDTMEQLRAIDQATDVELQFALRQFYSQLEALSIKEQASRRVEQEWEEQALEVSRKAQEYRNIQHNVERLQHLYDLVFSRLKEIDIAVGIEPESVRIMERAQPNTTPVAPRRLQSIFVAALLGVGIGLGLVFGLEYIDDSLRYPEEVAQHLGLPFYGLVPSANWDPEDLRTHLLANMDQKSGLAESYRNVRSSFLYHAPEDRFRSIVITSAVPREGKTTTCLNLAVSLAQVGARVLLVDGDLRRGELHKFFGLDGSRGFSEVLAGQAKAESVIQRTGLPNLDLVATGPLPVSPAEMVMRPEFQSFLEYVKRTYDRVLLDCPPVMAVSEAATLAALADGAILVVWAGHTSRRLSQLALQLMRDRGATVLGCVLNNLDFGRVGYYYYLTYYGYYGSEYRYGRRAAAESPPPRP